jgi:hypothetical protein
MGMKKWIVIFLGLFVFGVGFGVGSVVYLNVIEQAKTAEREESRQRELEAKEEAFNEQQERGREALRLLVENGREINTFASRAFAASELFETGATEYDPNMADCGLAVQRLHTKAIEVFMIARPDEYRVGTAVNSGSMLEIYKEVGRYLFAPEAGSFTLLTHRPSAKVKQLGQDIFQDVRAAMAICEEANITRIEFVDSSNRNRFLGKFSSMIYSRKEREVLEEKKMQLTSP